jgi:hypothetical protein
MNFVLFLILNVVLLVRPEELFPEIAGLRLYLIAILFCTLTSLPRLAAVLAPDSLRERPVAVCVLLFFAATVTSLCVVGRTNEALFEFGPEFAKVILYYFLLLAVVDSPLRFRVFVGTLVLLIGALTAVALAQHHGVTHFPNISPAMQRETDPITGEETWIPRLVSSGIFNDPNDLCLMLGLGMWSCLHLAATTGGGPLARLGWLLPIPLYVYALLETHSRGGLLGVLAGGAGYLYARYGGRRGLPLAVAAGVAAVAVIGGRQGSIGGGGTAHERLMLWASGLGTLFGNPSLLPTGLGEGWFVDDCGFVAHNSFVQAYVEQGLFGGGTFLAAFALAARLTDRLGRGLLAPDWAEQARPFALAVLAGYAVGCYSLTRNFVIPTYLTLGLVSVPLDQAAPYLPERELVSWWWFGWLAAFAVGGLVAIKLATQGLGMAGV